MNDRTSAYRCKLSPPYNSGYVKIGGGKKRVEVVEQSREAFTIAVPENIARKLTSNRKISLFYQGTVWQVICKNKWVEGDGRHLVELECFEESNAGGNYSGNGFGGSVRLQSTSAMDGTYAAVFLTVMTICILIMPAWGGRWGTAQIICNFAAHAWSAITSFIPGGHNLR